MAKTSPQRTTRNSSGNSQGQTPRVIGKPVRSPSQMCKDRHAANVQRSWPITRSNKTSRGIQRLTGNNECFRLAAIQALLHLPKFMNWILSHNENGRFACHPDIETKRSEHKVYDGVCPACSFKKLIQYYWGDNGLCKDGTPPFVAGEDEVVKSIHQLDNCISGLDGAEFQQDAEECQTRLILACLDSVDHTRTVHKAWLNQHDALFMLDPVVSRQCWHCHAVAPLPPGQDNPQIGFPCVPVKQSGKDTLLNALSRATEYVLPELKCIKCGYERIFEKVSIGGGPEILRIKLNINLDWDPVEECLPKNCNPVRLPQTLDLTSFQNTSARPLKYRLSSVLSHNGSTMTSGHWVAAVRGPRQVFAINDSYCVAEKNSFLSSNPQQVHSPPPNHAEDPTNYEAVVLTYVRVHSKAPLS